MGFLDRFGRVDIQAGVEQYHKSEGAVLLDVRSIGEYREGHIPESKNLDVGQIQQASSVVPDKETPLFVYCYSGSRSAQAVSALKNMGYTNVTNIGGIAGYHGQIER